MQWALDNWIWILLGGGMIAMHFFGHGRGGHGSGQAGDHGAGGHSGHGGGGGGGCCGGGGGGKCKTKSAGPESGSPVGAPPSALLEKSADSDTAGSAVKRRGS